MCMDELKRLKLPGYPLEDNQTVRVCADGRITIPLPDILQNVGFQVYSHAQFSEGEVQYLSRSV
jgi:hypothetical protein